MNKKGFTMVELLAVIAIIGILSLLAFVGVNRYISGAGNEKNKAERDNIAMAARLYLQANRDMLPRSMGESTIVYVSDLRRTNYLKEDVKNKDGKDCTEKSYVRVYKLDEKDYSYLTYLYCEGDEIPDEEAIPTPVILDFKFNGYGAGSDFSNVKNATFSFKIKGDNEADIDLGIYSYRYSIFAKHNDTGELTEVFNSGDLKAGNEIELSVTSKTLSHYFDVTGYNSIRINITAINEQGGKVEFNSSGNFKDTDAPLCGLISGQALSDDDWINKTIFNAGAYKNNFRRVSVGCADGEGSGCKRESFTASWPNDTGTGASGIDYSYGARWSYIEIEDNAQTTNKTKCYARVNVDVKAPTVTITAYKIKADGTKGAQVGTITVQDDGQRTATLPMGTFKANQFTDVVGTGSEKWMNKEKFPYGVTFDVAIDDNLYLYSYEWTVNNPYVAGGTKDAVVSSTASTTNATAEQNGGTAATGTFASPGLIDNPTNMEELKNAEHGIQTGTITGLKLRREGKRYARLVVCDKAGNCTTVNIFANIDRTPPLAPQTSYIKKTSNAEYTPANASNYTEHTLWSNEYLRVYINGQREDIQTEEAGTKVSLSGWDHFVSSYRRQTGKTNGSLTWANAVTKVISSPFSGTSQYGFDFSDQGTHRVAFLSCDKANNCSNYGEEDYPKIDTIKPTCDIVKTYTGTDGPNSAGWLKGGESVVLSHSCKDEDNKFSSGCNADSAYNKQSYNFNKDINTTKAGANGYENVYGSDDNTAGGHVIDYAGNISNECPKMTLKIDHIAPTCETVISYPQGNPLHPTSDQLETGWLGLVGGTGPSKKTAVVSLKCTDVKSTTSNGLMANVQSTCNNNHSDNKQSHIYGSEMNINNAGAVGAGKGGQVRDIAGNITPCPADRTVKIDYTIPVCTTAIEYATETNGTAGTFSTSTSLLSNGWLGLGSNTDNNVKDIARVKQVCTDPNGTQKSGCDGVIKTKTYNYQINTTQAGAVGVGDNGSVLDNAGNKANCTGYHTVKIDYTRPVCAVTMSSKGSGNGRNWTQATYTGGWVGKGATVTVRSTCTTAEDGKGNSSGCNTDKYYNYSSEIKTTNATSNGDNVDYYVKDKANNRSAAPCARQKVQIDLTSPKCTVTATYVKSGTPKNDSATYNSDWLGGAAGVRVISQCTSDPLSIGGTGSGCSETAKHGNNYSVSSGSEMNANKGSATNGDAYVITDAVGNSTTCGKIRVKIDWKPPACNVSSTASGWTNATSVTVSRTCSDSGSGCASSADMCYQSPTGCVTPPNADTCSNHQITASYIYTAESNGVFDHNDAGADGRNCHAFIYDKVGNKQTCSLKTVRIDNKPPTCTITQSPTKWTNGSVTVQGKCSDVGSGCKTKDTALKDTYSSEQNTTVNFSKTITDNAGNSATCSGTGYRIQIDKTAPTCSTSKSNTNQPGGVTTTVSCSDTGGSIVKTCAGASGTSYKKTGMKSGATYTVVDNAGNSNTCKVSVSSKTQNQKATCSTCNRCSGAGCAAYKTCTSSSCCGTTSSSYSAGGTYSSCTSTYGKNCRETGGGYTMWYCTCYTSSARTCTKSCCGCSYYNRSCSSCGCESGWSGYGNWYDGSHSAGWSGSTHYKIRTVYY